MKILALLATGLALIATSAVAQSVPPLSTPSMPMSSGGAPADGAQKRQGPMVRKAPKRVMDPRYSSGTPILAGDSNSIRIDGSGQVLYERP